jgi:hypothetical protein
VPPKTKVKKPAAKRKTKVHRPSCAEDCAAENKSEEACGQA